MKINIVGNVVNIGYSLSKWLRADGYKVELYVFDTRFKRDLPAWERDSRGTPEWVVYLPGSVVQRPLFPWPRVINQMRRCDLVISIGSYETILAARTGRPHVLWSMGAELDSTSFGTSSIHARLCACVLRRALHRCYYIISSMPFQLLDSIPKLGLTNTLSLPIPWDTCLYSRLPVDLAWQLVPAQLRDYALVIFAPAYHQIDPNRYHYKGNEKLVYAFREFLQFYQGRTCLIFTSYGEFDRTWNLVEELGLVNNVFLMDILDKQMMRAMYSLPNVIVCDQFPKYPISGAGFVGIETLLCEGILITAWDHDILQALYDQRAPVLHAREIFDIASRLQQVSVLSPEQRRHLGQLGRAWAIAHHAKENIIPSFKSILEQVARTDNAPYASDYQL